MTAATAYKRALQRAGDCLAYAREAETLEHESDWLDVAQKAVNVAAILVQILLVEDQLRGGTR